MKKLLSALFALTILASCSSTAVNQIKLDLADKAKDKTHKILLEEFKDFEPSLTCELEAVSHSEYVYEKTVSILKANKEQKSLTPIAVTICSVIVNEALPYLLEREESSSRCLRKLGSVKVSQVGLKVCQSIRI